MVSEGPRHLPDSSRMTTSTSGSEANRESILGPGRLCSGQTGLEIVGDGGLLFGLRPAQSMPDDVVEPAAPDVLALQATRQDVGSHEPLAHGEEPVGEDKVVVAPSASVQPLAIPAHGRVERLDEAEQGKERAIE